MTTVTPAPAVPPKPRRRWHPALDVLAVEAVRLTTLHLDGFAAILGVDECVALDRATMHHCVDAAVDLAVDEWLASRPASIGGLVLDPPPEAAAA